MCFGIAVDARFGHDRVGSRGVSGGAERHRFRLPRRVKSLGRVAGPDWPACGPLINRTFGPGPLAATARTMRGGFVLGLPRRELRLELAAHPLDQRPGALHPIPQVRQLSTIEPAPLQHRRPHLNPRPQRGHVTLWRVGKNPSQGIHRRRHLGNQPRPLGRDHVGRRATNGVALHGLLNCRRIR